MLAGILAILVGLSKDKKFDEIFSFHRTFLLYLTNLKKVTYFVFDNRDFNCFCCLDVNFISDIYFLNALRL